MSASALIEELLKGPGEVVARSVATALGSIADASVAVEEITLPPVDAYYVDYSQENVLTIYLLSSGRAIRHELTREGAHLTVAIGVDRIRRAFESFNEGTLTVGLELDADRTALDMRLSETDDGKFYTGNLTSAGWVIITSDPAVQARVAPFAAALRLALAV